ncbi:hypothetical protein INS49_010792 [Diaporthe citri]|uniref:uncharacterized protein n=1 Tax=Diaporthe citri TaxID=83186 RepID=UPI001C7E8099|nr:uncharacterized protein INS49_010792 [Diaporthe citri]KAG6359740.1 hypothetical protein INS49_010792 [Diaporthe citri]
MPRFLDLAFTFGKQVSEEDFHYTAFNEENFLDVSDAKRHCIPRLGRSGQEIRHCFNLWSVEKSDRPPYWSVRQTAVCHSFDVCTGRNVWINIKGNDLMQERITQAVSSISQMQPGSRETTSGSFSASLLTLLIVLEWSGENWKTLINDLEGKLSDLLKKAKNYPFKKIEEVLSLDPDSLLQHLTSTAATTGKLPRRTDSAVYAKSPSRADTFRSVLSSVTPTRILSGFSKASTSVDAETQDAPELIETKTPPEPLKPVLKPSTLQQPQFTPGTVHESKFSVLQEFSVDGLQKLTDIATRLHELKLVMKLNVDVIREITDYYKMLAESNDMPVDIKQDCAADLNGFFRRARAVTRGLEMEQSRSETLMRMCEDGKWLFDHILQFRNTEFSKLFAINAHQSGKHVEMMTNDMHQSSLEMEAMTKSMKKVAEKTAIQTSSMHIITLVTLFFLPATFVATFFSSGAFQWDQNDPDGSSMPFWKPEFFTLFSLICFPMTGAIICVWWALYWWNNRMRRQHSQGDEEQQQTV